MTQPPLTEDERQALREISDALAEQLGETETAPRIKLWRIVRVLGREEAMALLEEARAIEAKGGMLITDQSRRRTFGGVYFHLVRQRLHGQPTFSYVFPAAKGKHAEKAPGAQTAPAKAEHVAPALPVTWADRLPLIEAAIQDAGGASTMKVTIVGRPGTIIEKDQFVMMAMPTQKIPSLPKGLPVPSAQTQVLVYIAAKQWKKVAEAIQNPDDVLIVEGFALYEPQVRGIAVLASNVTTKLLQQAKKQEAPAS
jgi:hypothetical protein